MSRIIRRGFSFMLALLIIIGFLAGLGAGFKLGKEDICGDIDFYYKKGDILIKGCKELNKEEKQND